MNLVRRPSCPDRAFGRALAVLGVSACVGSFGAPRALAREATAGKGAPAYHDNLGEYERTALEEVLSIRKLTIDRTPEGKRVERIHVHNLDVFGPGDGVLRLLNYLHTTTRESVIEREVLPKKGALWDDDLAQQTRRRFNRFPTTSLALIVPIKRQEPHLLDVLAVTRDVWSLRLNSNFEYQAGALTLLHVELAENNFLGLRKQAALVYERTLGRHAFGPSYFDTNLLGRRWQLGLDGRTFVGRESGSVEGSEFSLGLTYPFWAFSDPWSFALNAEYENEIERRFTGIAGGDPSLCVFAGNTNACHPDPAAGVPWRYRERLAGLRGETIRQFGTHIIQRLRAGYRLNMASRSVFDEDFAAHPELLQPFLVNVIPRTEHVSALSLGYEVFLNEFVTYRDLGTYDFPEDMRMGPNFNANLQRSFSALGSTWDFWTLSCGAGFRYGGAERGLVRLAAGASGRVQEGALIDRSVSGSLFAATSTIAGLGRLVVRFSAEQLTRNRGNVRRSLGGDTGLRGYPVGAFQGESLMIANVEARTRPLRAGFMRVGLLAFWDAGHVARALTDLVPHHDFGLGLRMVIPQLQAGVVRFDWAIAAQDVILTNGDVLRTAGLPGRLSAGFSQVF